MQSNLSKHRPGRLVLPSNPAPAAVLAPVGVAVDCAGGLVGIVTATVGWFVGGGSGDAGGVVTVGGSPPMHLTYGVGHSPLRARVQNVTSPSVYAHGPTEPAAHARHQSPPVVNVLPVEVDVSVAEVLVRVVAVNVDAVAVVAVVVVAVRLVVLLLLVRVRVVPVVVGIVVVVPR